MCTNNPGAWLNVSQEPGGIEAQQVVEQFDQALAIGMQESIAAGSTEAFG